MDKLDELDKNTESIHLNAEVNLKHVLNDRLVDLLREEELKWYQRAKVRNLLEGMRRSKGHKRTRSQAKQTENRVTEPKGSHEQHKAFLKEKGPRLVRVGQEIKRKVKNARVAHRTGGSGNNLGYI